MANKITVRKGETLQVPIIIDDITADTVQFIAFSGVTRIIDETESFVVVDSQAEATISTVVTADEGDYSYILVITYDDGVIEKLPDIGDCEEDCGFPELVICEAEPEE